MEAFKKRLMQLDESIRLQRIIHAETVLFQQMIEDNMDKSIFTLANEKDISKPNKPSNDTLLFSIEKQEKQE